jgi:hypothetical protein
VKVVVANAVVGVPLIWPVDVENVSPVGKVAPESAKLNVPVPPVAVTGVNGVAALPTVKVVLGTACVVVNAGFTVRLKVFDEVCAVVVVWSVTVTVKIVVAKAVVGVPLIWPVDVENVSPVGNVPPESAKLNVPVPPVAVTGVNGVAALPTVRVLVGTACVVVNAGFTVRLKVFDEVCGVGVVWSVTVTVNVVVANAVVGVPLIWPFDVENVSPVGKVTPESAKLNVPMPPDAVTGVNGVAALPTVRVVLGTACVVVSGAFTFSVADVPRTLVAAPVALAMPVGIVLEPAVPDVTSTLNVQDEPAASVPPESESEDAFAMGKNVPPQVELAFGEEATVTPLGKVRLSATPDNPSSPAPLFGLVRVKVSVLGAPVVMVVGLADTAAVTAVACGNWRVRAQGVLIGKFEPSSLVPLQKKLKTAEGEPFVETTVN